MQLDASNFGRPILFSAGAPITIYSPIISYHESYPKSSVRIVKFLLQKCYESVNCVDALAHKRHRLVKYLTCVKYVYCIQVYKLGAGSWVKLELRRRAGKLTTRMGAGTSILSCDPELERQRKILLRGAALAGLSSEIQELGASHFSVIVKIFYPHRTSWAIKISRVKYLTFFQISYIIYM